MPRRCERRGSSRRHTHPCRETLPAEREREPLVRVRTAAIRMKKTSQRIVLSVLCAAMVLPAAGQPPTPAQVQTQAPAPAAPSPAARPRHRAAPPSAVTVDGSEAMFATMCALVAAGFESNVSADHWTAFRAQMRERLRRQQGPAVDAVREFYKQHELQDAGATLSRYLWFGLVTGPAPKFQTVLRRDEIPPEVLALEGFGEILSNYYEEQKIGQLWRQVQPIYAREVVRLHDSVSQIVFVSTAYLFFILDTAPTEIFTLFLHAVGGASNA